jgi:hypothetical protein
VNRREGREMFRSIVASRGAWADPAELERLKRELLGDDAED